MKQNNDSKSGTDSNLYSITGSAGAHPVGIGVGAAGGAVAGAAIGTAVGGPIGTAVGGAIGAATGALAGQSTAEIVNPTVEDSYWSSNFHTRSYVQPNRPYADYQPAYRYGWESRARMGNRPFDEVEDDLARGWDRAKGGSRMAWTQAKQATSDAWHRITNSASVDKKGCCS